MLVCCSTPTALTSEYGMSVGTSGAHFLIALSLYLGYRRWELHPRRLLNICWICLEYLIQFLSASRLQAFISSALCHSSLYHSELYRRFHVTYVKSCWNRWWCPYVRFFSMTEGRWSRFFLLTWVSTFLSTALAGPRYVPNWYVWQEIYW